MQACGSHKYILWGPMGRTAIMLGWLVLRARFIDPFGAFGFTFSPGSISAAWLMNDNYIDCMYCS